MPLNLILATRNLFYDRLRFVATMIGIVFSVVLVMVQMGLYLGFGQMVTTVIDHTSTDLWVMRHGTKCFEDPSLLSANKQTRVAAIAGVAETIPLVIGFSGWILPSGEITPVFVVGSDLQTLQPWNVTEGTVQALSAPGAVAVDRSYFERLGVSGIGSKANIRGHNVSVAAVTDGIRSFTTTPYIFSDLSHARTYIGIPSTMASYLLVKLRPGANLDDVRHELQASLPDSEVLTSAEFRERSRLYWLFGTGAGAALFAGAILGIIVGTVIVGQTLYSSTKDHLDEFATLRAMGSSRGYIYSVIIYQALLNAVIGFGLATLIGFAVVRLTMNGALPVLITPTLILAMLVLTMIMCVVSALAAIFRVLRVDPVMVFTR
ncbi:MAG: ABC transporter permease [Rhizobiales bacterium]|nr:ABC transporter permease [Hyphomicrobiales bacterium]